MKIIIVGVGKLGEYLARLLVKEKNEVTLIDLNFIGKESLINNEEVNYVEGNGLDSNTLVEAGINNADLLICVMKEDSENVMCALVGKKLGAKNTIARIRKPEYTNSINLIKEELGLSMVINPELLAASQISQALSIPSALDAISFLKGKIDVISLRIKEKSKLGNLTISDLSKKLKNNIIICAIERNGKVIIPTGNTLLNVGDKIHITGTRKDINAFLKFAKLISDKTHKVIISGGSNISIYLSKMLLDMGINVKIIERDEERCKFLSEKLPNALIINGDVSNQSILYEEGIDKCDAFVSLTNNDEENIVYSMFASIVKVPKIITKINHINLDGVPEKATLDTIITPHKIAANQVVQYVRAVENTGNSSCEAIYDFGENIFQMVEFKVKENFKALNKKLKNLKFKDNILIAVIQRGKNIIYPCGNDEIKLNDTIVIISKNVN
jgi:trk system potassium uptake protein TrkA